MYIIPKQKHGPDWVSDAVVVVSAELAEPVSHTYDVQQSDRDCLSRMELRQAMATEAMEMSDEQTIEVYAPCPDCGCWRDTQYACPECLVHNPRPCGVAEKQPADSAEQANG